MPTVIIFVLVFGSACLKIALPESREATKAVYASLSILAALMAFGVVTIGGSGH